MVPLIASILGVIVLGLIVLRAGKDEQADQPGLMRGLKIAALVVLGLQLAILLMFGFGEMFGGDWSGVFHLIPAATCLLMAWLGWLRPVEGGLILILTGVINLVNFFTPAAMLIMVVPLVAAGTLLLIAAWLGHGRKTTLVNP